MRAFLGYAIPPATRQWLLDQCAPLKALQTDTPLWVPSENLHLTLLFLGHLSPAQHHDIDLRLQQLFAMLPPPPAPSPVEINGFSLFPGHDKGRHYVANITPNVHLNSVRARILPALEPVAISVDARPYHPHITLARLAKNSIPVNGLPVISLLHHFDAGPLRLFVSQPTATGVRYHPIASYG